MGRLGVLVLVLSSLYSGRLPAQVVECPGFLPSSNVDKTAQRALAKELLGRFVAVLDLQGQEAIDENTIMAMYADHPEQLAIKLSYLSLQCQMVVFDAEITNAERRKAVRRVFLDYALMPPDTEVDNMTAYVNQITTQGQYQALEPLIATIEEALDQAPRRQWQKRWFPAQQPPSTNRSQDGGQWSVIVSSPRYEDEGWAELRRHQQSWPDVYFELDGPFDLDSPFYAVVAGRDLSAATAGDLLDKIKAKGVATDAFRWKAPGDDEALRSSTSGSSTSGSSTSRSPTPAIDLEIDMIKPTPPRPPLMGLDGTALSQ